MIGLPSEDDPAKHSRNYQSKSHVQQCETIVIRKWGIIALATCMPFQKALNDARPREVLEVTEGSWRTIL